jgi:hypothetical protein
MTGNEQTSAYPTTRAGQITLLTAILSWFVGAAFLVQAFVAPRKDGVWLGLIAPPALAVGAFVAALIVRFDHDGFKESRISLPISGIAVLLIPVYVVAYFWILWDRATWSFGM